MPKAKITFNKLIQDSQDYESSDENKNNMVSIIHFSLKVDDKEYEDMQVEIRQPYGTDYEKEPIEVGKIAGSYKGPWNHNEFADLCEQYYRSRIGSKGHGIRIQGGSNIRMKNNIFNSTLNCEMDIPEEGSTSW